MAYQIKRSSTGKYHLGTTGSTNANCNQWMRTCATTIETALSAPDHMFCDKCFNKNAPKAHVQRLIDIKAF